MRRYLRHSTSVGLEIAIVGESSEAVTASNLSEGGLCFVSDVPMQVGDVVDLRITDTRPEFICEGVVVWRREQDSDHYEVGVRFANDNEYFRARMVEQVRQIESYRERLAAVGRSLTSEAAAVEWIEKYASDFDDQSVFEDKRVAGMC